MLHQAAGDFGVQLRLAGAGTFCSGDSHDAGANPPLTTYLVRANTTPFDPNAAPIVNQGTCAGLQIPGFDKTFAGGTLDQGSGSYDAAMASVFRQWVPVCMLDPSTAPAGDYLLRCDRVDFPPGGEAFLHTHQGPGIRVLLFGSIRIETAALDYLTVLTYTPKDECWP